MALSVLDRIRLMKLRDAGYKLRGFSGMDIGQWKLFIGIV